MKKEQNVQIPSPTILDRIQEEYKELLSLGPISLQGLFEPSGFRFDEFCRESSPHAESSKLKLEAQLFGDRHGIWLANAKHHITCALFLYPTAQFERMLSMMKNLTLGFYLNDTMGRDTFKFLDDSQQKLSRVMIEQMATLDRTLHISGNAHPLEHVNAEILKEFRDNSPKEWFAHFLEIYCYHIAITHTDGNSSAQGKVPDVVEYMDRRCHLGGVHHILLWIEFSENRFLDWPLLKEIKLDMKLKRLHWVTAAFAGLSNDLFSFEKEVIDCGSDSNLVMIIALNHPDLRFREAVYRSADIVRALLMEILSLIATIRQEANSFADDYPQLSATIAANLAGVVKIVQATWMWHCHSGRYKRPISLWCETTLIKEDAK